MKEIFKLHSIYRKLNLKKKTKNYNREKRMRNRGARSESIEWSIGL